MKTFRSKVGLTYGPPAGLATIITIVAWALLNNHGRSKSAQLLALLGGVLQIPGGLVAVALAVLFSPQGGHGVDDFSWVIVPATWVVYFFVLTWLFRRLDRARRENATSGK